MSTACAAAPPIDGASPPTPDAPPQRVASYPVSDEPIANPERGLLQLVDMTDPRDVQFVAGLGVTLVATQIRLDAFRDRALDAELIAELDAGFARIRRAGLKAVVRFQYNAGSGEDPPVSVVLGHIDQLEPLMRRNADVIAVMQAGFIGAWGEWHGSHSGLDSEDSRRAILLRLLDALPDDRAVQVRSPVFKATLMQHADRRALNRVGHHNDCALFDNTDRGTYPPPTDKWRDYVARDSTRVPVGGETCGLNPPRTDCGHAVHELRMFGWSYLNQAYHPDVIRTWRRQGCLATIERDLGYRLIVQRATWPARAKPGQQIQVRLEIENLGYAAPYNPRDVALVIGTGPSRIVQPIPDALPTGWHPGRIHELTATVRLPATIAPGPHPLALWLPDPSPTLRDRPAYAIRLSNSDMWRVDDGANVLGQLRVAGAD